MCFNSLKTKKARRREPVLLSKSNLSPQIIQISRYNIKLILSQNPTKIQANPTFAALISAVSLWKRGYSVCGGSVWRGIPYVAFKSIYGCIRPAFFETYNRVQKYSCQQTEQNGLLCWWQWNNPYFCFLGLPPEPWGTSKTRKIKNPVQMSGIFYF